MSDTVIGTSNQRPISGVHYHLHSYICGSGCVKPSPFEGWAPFETIFQQRPNLCRFAVARCVPVSGSEPQGPWLCWDLYADTLMRGQLMNGLKYRTFLLQPPPPKWQGATADGLIMKAMALYDRD
jgi:hypothetical protein